MTGSGVHEITFIPPLSGAARNEEKIAGAYVKQIAREMITMVRPD